MKIVATSILVLVAMVRIAAADALSHTIEFKPSGKAAIKVLGPEGARVTGAGADDTLPTVLQVENADAFIPVTITFKGETLTTKIEVKRGQTSEVRVAYTAPAAAADKKPGRTYVAKLNNHMHKCADAPRTALIFELVNRVSGATLGAFEIKAGKVEQLNGVAAGELDVRISEARSKKWLATKQYTIDKDGVVISYGCE